MGMSEEALRLKSQNASSKRTWIYISNGGSVISIEEAIEVASFNTVTKWKVWVCTNGTWRDAQESLWEVLQLW